MSKFQILIRKLVDKFQINFKNNKGFTLVELLVVISIIGVLTAVGTVNFMEIRKKTRDQQRKADLNTIRQALEVARADIGTYPVSGAGYPTSCGGTFTVGSRQFLKRIPCDPSGVSTWNGGVYWYFANTRDYVLISCLEDAADSGENVITSPPSTITVPTTGPAVPISSVTCSSNKYYVVRDPN